MFRFKPRVYVHPDRYGPAKTLGANRLLVVHTSEGGETANAAENLCGFLATKGDHFNGATGNWFGASYQYITDTDEGVFPATGDGVVAYAAAGANHDGIHFCIPGKAGQTRAQWLDADSTQHMASLAWAMKRKSLEHDIPLVKLTVAQVKDGKSRGYCSHHDVSLAFGKSTHTDPGKDFPWDVLANLLAPPLPPDPPGGPIVAGSLKAKKYRLYDSREHDGKLYADQVRQLGITDPDAAGAVGIVATFGLSETEGAGFFDAWDAAAWPGTITVPWNQAGAIVAGQATVWLGGYGTFQTTVKGAPNAAAHFTVDVVGYWMP